MLEFIKKYVIKAIKSIIEIVEFIEYSSLELDENDVDKKILNSISVFGIKVKTDTGYKYISDIHLTQPYRHYILETEMGYRISCADKHIVFDENFNEIFVKDLKIGNFIQTEKGLDVVKKMEIDNFKSSMFDCTIMDNNHRYYTNGILSHNTISSSIFMLHTILFNNDKNIMVVANKGDTAVEIVDKIKSIYTLLPYFLKSGVKTWNQKSLTFENSCRIKTSARSKTPAIGFTIDVLYLDEFAHIPSNIIEPYYTAAFPTVSAVKNSKIIITSTPNGMNLFHKLLINAERPEGDPLKNNYKPMRVYWHQVPGRFVTYLRLNEHHLYKYGVTKDYIFDLVREKFPPEVTKTFMEYNIDFGKDIINIFNNDLCTEDDVKALTFKDSDGMDTSIFMVAEVSTWRDEAIKDIGGEDAFNQEYGLRFINSSKSLLKEDVIEELLKKKKNYKFEDIIEFNSKLKFSYKDLKWIDDDSVFSPIMRYSSKFVLSVDISEGLGQDYSIINIFKISEKSKDIIELQKHTYKSIVDFFRLEQVGIYRSNYISIKQLSELLYMLAFEYLNPENVKIVLELNNYGGTLLAEMPHVFDGYNNYGSSIFFRYKHRVDATEEKVGLKVGENKNMLVKSYQDLMLSKSFTITNEDTIREITTFVKQTSSSGNTRYAADVGNDDCVMTIVNATSAFEKNVFKEMCQEYLDNNTTLEFRNYVNEILNNIEYVEAADYKQLLDIRRRIKGNYANQRSINNNIDIYKRGLY